MKRFRVCLLVVCCMLVLGFPACTDAGNVPQEIRKLIFEESDFADPILLKLPKEGSRDFYDAVKSGAHNTLMGIMSDVDDLHPSLRHFLTQNDLATFETVHWGPRRNRRTDWVFYTEKFKDLLIELDRTDISDNQHKVQVAHRKLKSIDYTNQYEATSLDVPVTYFALTFTYTMETDFDDFPKIDTTFQGKAKVYRDPDTGQWELEEFSTEDRGINEYLKLVRQPYMEIVENQRQRRKDVAEALRNYGTSLGEEGQEKLRSYVDSGVNPNQLVGQHAPLTLAAKNGWLGIAEQLIERGADVDVLAIWTPLYGALLGGHFDIVRLLIENGADPNLGKGYRDTITFTPLHIVICPTDIGIFKVPAPSEEERKEIIKLLLEHGADPSKQDTKGRTVYDVVSWCPLPGYEKEENKQLLDSYQRNRQQ